MQRLVSFHRSVVKWIMVGHVSLAHNLAMADTPTASTSTLAIDMGSMGTLTYGQGSGGSTWVLLTIDDVMPTADEEVRDGISTDGGEGGTAYEVNGGGNGFNYNYSSGMVYFRLVGVSPGGTDAEQDDGANGGSDGAGSDTSIAVKVAPMDGLTLLCWYWKSNGSVEIIQMIMTLMQLHMHSVRSQLVTKNQKLILKLLLLNDAERTTIWCCFCSKRQLIYFLW